MDSEAHVRLTFAGEVLDGFRAEDVRRRFGEAFKLDEAKLANMFSGARTVLKRSLSPAEAERYVAQLRKLGARVYVEPAKPDHPASRPAATPAAISPASSSAAFPPIMPPAPTQPPERAPGPPPAAPDFSLTPLQTPAAAAAALPPLAPLEDEITCPNCGERQSKRVLCRSCSTDMPRGIAAKKEDEERARQERRAARGGRFAPPNADVDSHENAATEEPPPVLSLSFDGRMGRLTYFNFGVLSMVGLAGIGIAAAILIPLTRSLLTFIPLGLFFVAFLVWTVRVSVLRLHDLNRSGWWVPVLFIPYVGGVFSLALVFWPGTSGDNDYGEQPRRGSAVVAVIIGVLIVLSLLLATRTYNGYVKKARAAASGDGQAPSQADPATMSKASQYLSSPAALQSFGEYAAERDHKGFAASDSGAYGWVSGQGSPREAARRALAACEEKRKPYTSECALVNVNGMWAGEQQR